VLRTRLVESVLSRLGEERLSVLEAAVQHQRGQGWGTATVAAEVAAARQLAGPNVELVVDVGANRGAWTREALTRFPDCHVHAFEPSKNAFSELSSSLGSEPRVALWNTALGATEGTATLYADKPGSELGSLTQRRLGHFGIDFDLEEHVTVTTLPAWFAESGVTRIDVLKLDTEGHELEILDSAASVLDRVGVVQFEFGGCNIDTRTFLQDFWYLLTGAGYRLHRLGPNGLTPVDRYRETDEVFVTTNYFAAR
jgi:FkbM family methyltransferase